MLALLSLLDEYVGVSNANAHLRAGLGRSMQVLVAHPPDVRPRAVHRQGLLADDQHVVARQVRVHVHPLKPDLQAGQQFAGFWWWVHGTH